MKGNVEVYGILDDGSEELILSESNLIVDGAGETIAEMMSVPSSTLSYAPEVLDASNWNFAALTFAPAKKSFGQPFYANTSCADGSVEFLGANASYVTLDYINDPNSWLNTSPTQRVVRVVQPDGAAYHLPPNTLPSYPDPLDTDLEPEAQYEYVSVSADGQTFYGHHENRIYFNGDTSSWCIGAFAVTGTADNIGHVLIVSSLEGDFSADKFLNCTASTTANNSNTYNGKSLIDKHGFVTLQHEVDSAYIGTNAPATFFKGTETTRSNQITQGFTEITTYVHGKDILMMNIYGGIHHIGLWTYDNKRCLDNTSAPYDLVPDGNGDTGLRYRLFAKKTFTENLAIRSNLSFQRLKLVWRIDFRS